MNVTTPMNGLFVWTDGGGVSRTGMLTLDVKEIPPVETIKIIKRIEGEETADPFVLVPPLDKSGTKVVINSKSAIVWRKINSIRLNTEWSLIDGFFVPVFEKQPGSARMVFDWAVPPDMSVVFCTYHTKSESRMMFSNASIFAIVSGRSRAIILPNIFTNAEICLGDSYQPDFNLGLIGEWEKAQLHFQDSVWNADLYDGNREVIIRKWFRFDPNGKQAFEYRETPIISSVVVSEVMKYEQ